MEKIKCAAIKYRTVSDPDNDKIVSGHDHTYCREYFMCAEIRPNDLIVEVEGFLTTSDRFVDRSEAYDIALKAGQLIYQNESNILKSYNVKYATQD